MKEHPCFFFLIIVHPSNCSRVAVDGMKEHPYFFCPYKITENYVPIHFFSATSFLFFLRFYFDVLFAP